MSAAWDGNDHEKMCPLINLLDKLLLLLFIIIIIIIVICLTLLSMLFQLYHGDKLKNGSAEKTNTCVQ